MSKNSRRGVYFSLRLRFVKFLWKLLPALAAGLGDGTGGGLGHSSGGLDRRAEVGLRGQSLGGLAQSQHLGKRGLCGGSIAVEELSRYPIAYYNEQVLNLVVDRLFASRPDCTARIAQHSSNAAQIGKMVAAGHAVTFGDTFSRYASGVMGAEEEAPAFARVIPTQTVTVGFLLDGESPLLASQLNYVRCFKAMLESRFGNYLRFFSAR